MKCKECGRWISSRQIAGDGTLCPTCYAVEAVREAHVHLTNKLHDNKEDVTVHGYDTIQDHDAPLKRIVFHRKLDGGWWIEAENTAGIGENLESYDNAFVIAKLKEYAQLIGNEDET